MRPLAALDLYGVCESAISPIQTSPTSDLRPPIMGEGNAYAFARTM